MEVFLPYVEGYDVGLGLLRATGEPRNKSIKGMADGVSLALGGEGSITLTRVETTEDLETELGINVSARGGVGIYKVEDKFEFSNKCKLHAYSLALLIRAEQTLGFVQIDELELTDNAKTLVATNPQAFVDQYGDCFIRGIKRGGELLILIRIDTRDQQSRETIKNTLNASAGISFSAEAMISLNKTLQSTNSETQIFIKNIGGLAAPVSVSTPEQISAVIAPWTNSLQTLAAPFAVTLTSYKIVAGFDPPDPADLQHQQDIIRRCETLRYSAIDGLNQIDYVLSNRKVFVTIDELALTTARSGFASDVDVISQARAFAERNPIQAVEPETYARTKLLRPDYKLTTLPAAMPPLPLKPIIIPNLTGWYAEDLDFMSAAVKTPGEEGGYWTIDEYINGVPETDQDDPPIIRPRDVLEFLAYHRSLMIDPEPGYVPQGQNFVTAQDPPPGTIINPGDTVRISAGGAYQGMIMPYDWDGKPR
ncbi:MAG: hypothetical protein JF628_11625 [Sphingomonas sp.]|nr:hypothetical protein [Sphingomonas sp.]